MNYYEKIITLPTNGETVNVKFLIHFFLAFNILETFLFPLQHKVDSSYEIMNSHVVLV